MKKRTRFITMLIAVALMCGIGTASAASEKVQKDIYYNGIKITLNGNTVTPKTESGNVVDPFLMDGTTYLPVRALANALGMGVDWEGETRTVLLTSSNTASSGTLSPSAVFAQCSPSVVHIHTAFGGGTGFFIEKNVTTPDNPVHGTDGGSNTTDKVYLPSLEEVMKYYNITTEEEKFYDGLYAQATPYAVSKGVWLELAGSSKCWWWLRSSGGSDQNAAEVGSAGYLSFNGSDASSTVRALRPVIQITN